MLALSHHLRSDLCFSALKIHVLVILAKDPCTCDSQRKIVRFLQFGGRNGRLAPDGMNQALALQGIASTSVMQCLTRAPLGYFYNAPHWGGAISSPPPL